MNSSSLPVSPQLNFCAVGRDMFMRAEQAIRQIEGLSCENFRLVAGAVSFIIF